MQSSAAPFGLGLAFYEEACIKRIEEERKKREEWHRNGTGIMMAEMLVSHFSKLNVCAKQGPRFQLGWDLKVTDFKCKRPNLAGCNLKPQLLNGA
jgi:hypothetical protein